MRHPAVPPAVTLLVGVAVGLRAPGLSSGPLVVLVGLAWLCTVLAFLGGRNTMTTLSAMMSFLLVGVLLGAQATTQATTTELWEWYQRQAPQLFSALC